MRFACPVLLLLVACGGPREPEPARPDADVEEPTPPAPTTPDPTTPAPTTPTGVAAPCPLTKPRTPLAPTADCAVWRVDADLTWSPTLEIAPGTILEMAPGVSLHVVGDLLARGTADAPIVLRSQGTGAWGGLDLTGVEGYDYLENYDTAELTHVQIRDAGAGVTAAIRLSGTFYALGYYGGGGFADLAADGLSLHGIASAGIEVTDNVLSALTPIGFEDVAGPLVATDFSNLDTDLALDLGGNAAPWIEARDAWSGYIDPFGTWAAQSVPIHVLDPVVLDTWEGYDCYRTGHGAVTIEANTVLFDADAGFEIHGGRLEIVGATLGPLAPGGSWPGIVGKGDDALRDCGDVLEVHTSVLALTDAVLTGTQSPAISWSRKNADDPVITGTTITDVVAPAGDDVCVAIGSGCPDLAADNALGCTTPVSCI